MPESERPRRPGAFLTIVLATILIVGSLAVVAVFWLGSFTAAARLDLVRSEDVESQAAAAEALVSADEAYTSKTEAEDRMNGELRDAEAKYAASIFPEVSEDSTPTQVLPGTAATDAAWETYKAEKEDAERRFVDVSEVYDGTVLFYYLADMMADAQTSEVGNAQDFADTRRLIAVTVTAVGGAVIVATIVLLVLAKRPRRAPAESAVAP